MADSKWVPEPNPTLPMTEPKWPEGAASILPDSIGEGSGMAAVTVPPSKSSTTSAPKNPPTTWSADNPY